MSIRKPLKSILSILLVGLCGRMTASAQTPIVPPNSFFVPGIAKNLQEKLEAMTPEERLRFLETHPIIRRRFEEGRALLARYAQMSAGEQQEFLRTHGPFQRFIQTHPQATVRTAANASEAKPGVIDPNHPRVNEVNGREENQQQRIAQGDAAGALSAGQTAKIEGQENKIQSQETKDMDQHNGHLTKPEQNQLNREENHTSAEIFDDKHGIAKPGVPDPGHPRVNEVTDRQENQQRRIAQGDASGTLSGGQTAHIEKEENKIEGQKLTDMSEHGGHLTRKEQRQLNRKENHTSHQIHKDKHIEKEKK